MTTTALAAGSLIANGIHAWFAPVDRAGGLPVLFDPASMGRFDRNTPPAGWWSAGRVLDLKRTAASTVTPVWSGAPAAVKAQVSAAIGEEVEFTLPGWTRLGMSLSSGTEVLNLFTPAGGGTTTPSGGTAALVETLLPGSTATVLQLQAGSTVQAGDLVVVDIDYTGQSGFLGSGGSGTYVASSPGSIDLHLTRRFSLNVGRVLSVDGTAATLATPLPAGEPTTAMRLSRLSGFTDRTGGAFVPEWSALFVWDGVQGDRILLHYPRLQPTGDGTRETHEALVPGVERWRPLARLRALPITDANGNTPAVCFRTYLPAPMRQA